MTTTRERVGGASRVATYDASLPPGATESVLPAGEPHPLYFASKRALDILGAVILVVIASPLLLLACLAIVVSTWSTPIYRQYRIGQGGRQFRVYKLRSMRPDADRNVPYHLNETGGPTFKAKSDPRITPVGRILRKTSLDEVPQVVNVLRGQMSLVGPRPALPRELEGYAPEHFERLGVKPGLTGLWQVSGRNDVGFDRWMELDREYVRSRSLWLDLVLLARTPLVVVTMRGAR